jgi:hypothetical protein
MSESMTRFMTRLRFRMARGVDLLLMAFFRAFLVLKLFLY